MSRFRRSQSDGDPDDDQSAAEGVDDGGDVAASRERRRATTGPFDEAEAVEDRPRIDFGSVRLPAVEGMEVRVETADDGQVMTIGVVLEQSVLQVQAFAAPRSAGIWDDVRADLADGLRSQGGSVEDAEGPFGHELKARLRVQRPDGSEGMETVRFLGVDGPRWFLRGVLSGAAGSDRDSARQLEELFAGIVVVRGDQAAPPREPLALQMPDPNQPVNGPDVPGEQDQ